MPRKPTYQELAHRVEALEEEILTTRRKIEELRIQVDQSREFARLLPEIVFEIDPSGKITFVNRASHEITGFSQEDLARGFDPLNLLAPADREKARRNISSILRGEEVGMSEYTVQRKDGTTFPVLARSTPVFVDGKIAGLRGFLIDNTDKNRTEAALRESREKLRRHQDALEGLVAERTADLQEANERLQQEIGIRKQIEEELRESETRYRMLVEQMPAVTYTARLDEANTAEYVSPQIEDLLGFGQRDFIQEPDTWRKALHPDDREKVLALAAQARERGDALSSEYRLIHRSGKTVWVRDHACIVRDDRGDPLFLQGVMLDITVHKKTEEALRESEERFRTVFEGSLDAIVLADPRTGQILDANPTASELLAKESEEIIGLSYKDFIDPGSEDYAEGLFGRVARDESAGKLREIPARRADGNDLLLEVIGQLIQIDGRPVVLIVARDITERKKTEQELQKIQKLESLGILAGGIAHDFNNILTAISTNLSMARVYGDLREEISQMLADAENASSRAQNLTRQLLAFAKGGAPIKSMVSIGALIRETAEFALRGSNVGCRSILPDDLWLVEADQGQISQVIQNLIINADQAMPRGGTVEIRAENVMISEKGTLPLRPGPYLSVSVADQGIGIPKQNIPNIFDPFFTTKRRGSGLGLSTAFSIINNHDGHIEVESEFDRGTTFTLYLPALAGTSSVKQGARPDIPEGEGRLLLVDDEEEVRKAAGRALTRLGYEVQFANDGAAGIELYREALEAGRPFHAVIMDLTIPGGIGGREAVGRILEIDPAARVVASSGYSSDPVLSRFREHGFAGILTKPYRIEDLGEVLSQITVDRRREKRAPASRKRKPPPRCCPASGPYNRCTWTPDGAPPSDGPHPAYATEAASKGRPRQGSCCPRSPGRSHTRSAGVHPELSLGSQASPGGPLRQGRSCRTGPIPRPG